MKKFGNKIEKLLSIDPENFSIQLRFEDGESGVVSLKNIFEHPKAMSAEILKGEMFNRCFIESGALAWPNGFELCPDTLRNWLDTQRKTSRKAAR